MNRIDAILLQQDEKNHKIEAFLDALVELLQSTITVDGVSPEGETPSILSICYNVYETYIILNGGMLYD